MTTEQINKIIDSGINAGYNVIISDIVFTLLRDNIGAEAAAYLATGKLYQKLASYANSPKMKFLRRSIHPNISTSCAEDVSSNLTSKGKQAETSITEEENMASILKMIADVERKISNDEIEFDKGIKLLGDFRFKLKDKFDMDKSEDERRVVVVPHKHDFVCPHTNKECSYPSKKMCMEHYNLIARNE